MESKNNEKMSLGGNIELNGFHTLERSKLTVLKKIIGNYARQIRNKRGNYSKLSLALEGAEYSPCIKAMLDFENSTISGEGGQGNIFMAVDSALKKVIEQI